MTLNVAALATIVVLYVVIFLVGLLGARKKRQQSREVTDASDSRLLMNGGRSLGLVVSTFTVVATWVDGGFLNGTVEVITARGLVWCQAVFGYSLSLLAGGLFIAGPMWRAGYVTMMDPLQETYGDTMASLLFLPALVGEVCWCGSIFNALGSTLSVVTGLDGRVSIGVSAAVAVLYTVTGGVYSVAYTDVVQLSFIFIGLWICVPFMLLNGHADPIWSVPKDELLGSVAMNEIPSYVDTMLLFIFGGIPWQDYFQRILSTKSEFRARALSLVGFVGTLAMAVPPVLIGVAVKATRWNETTFPSGADPTDEKYAPMMLPLALQYLTPTAVSCVGLGVVAAAVMSSADSCLLSCGSMAARNIYVPLLRPKASDTEVVWVLRLCVVAVAALSAIMAVAVRSVYDLWALSADLVYVVLLPQLLAAVFLGRRWCNAAGSVTAFTLGLALRVLGGEPVLGIPAIMQYPLYEDGRQLFPFKTTTMLLSGITLLAVSRVAYWVTGSKHASRRETPPLPACKLPNEPTLTSNDLWK
ncbi:high-affinity choline transporter 1-like [Dermacentor variabilis]|uniref:high-affinity choline transporter 1-like n=1 Tax=Dermacentor variabilis TaxID=34621 RepID=UPI003F5BFD3C